MVIGEENSRRVTFCTDCDMTKRGDLIYRDCELCKERTKRLIKFQYAVMDIFDAIKENPLHKGRAMV